MKDNVWGQRFRFTNGSPLCSTASQPTYNLRTASKEKRGGVKEKQQKTERDTGRDRDVEDERKKEEGWGE